MKKIIVIALALGVALLLWAKLTYPTVGVVAMQLGGHLEAKLHGFTKKQVKAGDINITLYEGGDATKPAMVLLHGYSADKDVWPRFAAHLVNDYHIVIPDIPGHGETGFKPEWAYDMPSQAKHIIALMDAMHIDKAHVIGNSMGGFLTVTLAANYPARLLTAVAIDPAGVVAPNKSKLDLMLAAGRNPFEINSGAEFTEFYAMTMAKPPYFPQFMLDGMAHEYMKNRESLKVIQRGFVNRDMFDQRLADIKTPILFIWGKQDALLDVSSLNVWLKGIPQAKSYVFDDLGHMPMVEAPAQTAQVVRDYLTSNAPAGQSK